MLKNMGNAGRVGGRRAKAHAKAFVLVGIDDGKQLRSGDIVLPQPGGAVHFMQILFGKKSKTVLVHGES
jgi:hypothetical protein